MLESIYGNYNWKRSRGQLVKSRRRTSPTLELLLGKAKESSPEERSKTVQAYRNAVDPEEKKRLREEALRQHIRFVYKVASRFFPLVSHIPGAEEDLVQEGILGFFHALDLVDEEKSVLISYCKWWVANACTKWVKNNGLPFRVPQHWDLSFLEKKVNFFTIDQKGLDDEGNPKESIDLVSPLKGPEETFFHQETLDEQSTLVHQVKLKFFEGCTKSQNTRERNWNIFTEYRVGKKTLQTLSNHYQISKQRVLQIVYEVERKTRKILSSMAKAPPGKEHPSPL